MNSTPLKNATPKKKYFQNTSLVNANNVSGTTGVSWKRTKLRWVASIQFNGKCQHLGVYQVCEEAIAMRKMAERAYDVLIQAGATKIDFTKQVASKTYLFSAMIDTESREPLTLTVELSL